MELKKEFIGKGQVRGFMFTQIEKSNKAYIYRIEADKLTHYEVFTHKWNNRFNCVSYPTNNAFGVWAWTYRNLDKAMDKFNELNERAIVNG